MDSQWQLKIEELIEATNGLLVQGSNGGILSGVVTDSRKPLAGQLFVALKGESHDAHSFVEQVIKNGAGAVLVHDWQEAWGKSSPSIPVIKVKNTLVALQALARFWRLKHQFKVVGITGSNGKTTTKEIARHLLSKKFEVSASKGSFNNHWGVPLSILEASPEHTHLILEMGMNHKGEIFRLCQIAEPDVVVVTTVGRAHVGELGSLANVAEAKEEIYAASPKAVPVFNMDNEWTMRMATRTSAVRSIQFSSFKKEVDVYLRAEKMDWSGLILVGRIGGAEGRANVPMFGRHIVANAMAAVGVGLALGMNGEELWKGLEGMNCGVWGRNQLLSLKSGSRVVFDAYNSNPDSFQTLLKNIYENETEGRKFLIAGEMKELGEFSEGAHEEAGERAGHIGFTGVWFVGEHAEAFLRGIKKSGARTDFSLSSLDVDEKISEKILAQLRSDDVVVIKGSRGMALERVLKGWPLTSPLGSKD